LENRLIGYMIIVLVIGLAAGYTLNYMISQPQIQRLEDEQTNLNNQIASLTGIIANTHSTSTPTATPTPNPNTSSTPAPTSNPSGEGTLVIDSANASVGSDGNFAINFRATNNGPGNVNITGVYLQGQQNLPGVTAIILNGVQYTPYSEVNLQLSPGAYVDGSITITSMANGGQIPDGVSLTLDLRTASGEMVRAPNDIVLP